MGSERQFQEEMLLLEFVLERLQFASTRNGLRFVEIVDVFEFESACERSFRVQVSGFALFNALDCSDADPASLGNGFLRPLHHFAKCANYETNFFICE